jgi:hypothetical protein
MVEYEYDCPIVVREREEEIADRAPATQTPGGPDDAPALTCQAVPGRHARSLLSCCGIEAF